MIIYFTKYDEYINFDNVVRMGNGLTDFKRHYILFVYPNGETYKYVFWGEKDKEAYTTAMSKIHDAFKKRKRYIEIDG